jgi:hypothetical protein
MVTLALPDSGRRSSASEASMYVRILPRWSSSPCLRSHGILQAHRHSPGLAWLVYNLGIIAGGDRRPLLMAQGMWLRTSPWA